MRNPAHSLCSVVLRHVAAMGEISFEPILPDVGKRAASRLRLRLAARIMTTAQFWPAELLDLSYFGGRIACDAPPQPGQEVLIEWADFDAFGMVVWANVKSCGVCFFEPLQPAVLIATRDRFDVEPVLTSTERARNEAKDYVQGWAKR
ncbi:MAG: PilZ domain-containing protein [Novosphingobium sp.]